MRVILGKSSKSRSIEKQLYSAVCQADYYDTGLVEIFESGQKLPKLIHMTNTRELFAEGYVDKLLEVTENSLEHVSTLTTNNESEFPRRRQRFIHELDYNDRVSGRTVREILDSNDLSDVTKFSAIVSFLTIAPTLTFEQLMVVVEKQTPPEELPTLPIWRTSWFLSPDFATSESHKDSPRFENVKMDAIEFFNFHYHVSFIAHGLEDETYSEYLDRVDNDWFKIVEDQKIVESMIVRYKVNTSSNSIESFLVDLTKDQLFKFSVNSLNVHQDLYPILHDRIKSGVVVAADDDKDTGDTTRYRRIWQMDKILTRSEIFEVLDFLEVDKAAYSQNMNSVASSTIAFYMISGGIHAVADLLRFVTTGKSHTDFFYSSEGYKTRDRVQATIRPSHFMQAIEGEFKDMPLEWALNLVTVDKTPRSRVLKHSTHDSVVSSTEVSIEGL